MHNIQNSFVTKMYKKSDGTIALGSELHQIGVHLTDTEIFSQTTYKSTLGSDKRKSALRDKASKLYDKIKLESTTEILATQNEHATKLHHGVQKEARILYQNEMQMSQADLRAAQRRAAKAAKKALKQSGQ